jgi:DNA-binding Lrp family transcriptional regulator
MRPMPQLDDLDKRVLRSIQAAGVVPGWQLISEASVSPDELVKSAGNLLDQGLISVTGSINNPSEITKCFFSIQPSSSRYTEFVLTSK